MTERSPQSAVLVRAVGPRNDSGLRTLSERGNPFIEVNPDFKLNSS